MPEKTSTRRKFLQFLGLSAGAALTGKQASASVLDPDEIRKLTPAQQKFMLRYEVWMSENIEVIRAIQADPNDMENHNKMMALADRAEGFKPELDKFMQDPNFALIYNASIQRMTSEIKA